MDPLPAVLPKGQHIEIAPDKWASVRRLLEQLYIDEKMSLKDVRTFMSNHHQFHASNNQLQRKLNKWKCWKNLKRKQGEEFIVSHKKRKLSFSQESIPGTFTPTDAKSQRGLRRDNRPGLSHILQLKCQPSANSSSAAVGGDRGRDKSSRADDSLAIVRKRSVTVNMPSYHLHTQLHSIPLRRFMEQIQHVLPRRKEGALRILDIFQDLPGHRAEAWTPNSRQEEAMVRFLHENALDKTQPMIAPLIYQLSNCLVSDKQFSRILMTMISSDLESILESFFTTALPTARAIAETIVRICFDPWSDLRKGDPLSTTKARYVVGKMQDIVYNPSFVYASPSHDSDLKFSILQAALLNLETEVAMMLLDRGADIHFCASHPSTEVASNRKSCCAFHPVNLLVEHMNIYRMQGKRDQIPVIWNAVRRYTPRYSRDLWLVPFVEHPTIMRHLLDAKVAPDSLPQALSLDTFEHLDKELTWLQHVHFGPWLTALQYAVASSNIESVSMLLHAGARSSGYGACSLSRHSSDDDHNRDYNQMHHVSRKRLHEILHSPCSLPPLSIACATGNIDMIQLLLQHGATIEGCQLDSSCARISASENGPSYCSTCTDSTRFDEHWPSIDSIAFLESCFPDGYARTEIQAYLHTLHDDCFDWEDAPSLPGFAPIQIAVFASPLPVINFLLERRVNVEGCHGLTALGLAAANSDHALIRQLLVHGANPNGCTTYGPHISPLTVAAYLDDVPTMELLIDCGACLTSPGTRKSELQPWQAAMRAGASRALAYIYALSSGIFPQDPDIITHELKQAITNHKSAVFRLLIGTVAQSSYRSQDLMHCALKCGNLTIIHELLRIGGSIDEPELWDGPESYHFLPCDLLAVIFPENINVQSSRTTLKILQKGVEIEASDSISMLDYYMKQWCELEPRPTGSEIYDTLIIFLDRVCLTPGHEEAAAKVGILLLQNGLYTEPPERDMSKSTPVQLAAKLGSLALVRRLILLGADVNACPRDGDGTEFTALQYAISRRDLNLTQYLLQNNAEVNSLSPLSIETALQLAIRYDKVKNTPLVDLLLQNGADVNQLGHPEYGYTALQTAAMTSNIQLVKLLIERGAEINQAASLLRGCTALQAAVVTSNIQLVELLLDKEADINQAGCSDHGRTALQAAAMRSDTRLVNLLIERGADVNSPPAPNGGTTALQAAAISGSIEIFIRLMDKNADIEARPSRRAGRTAIEGAAEYGRLDLVKMILDILVKKWQDGSKDVGHELRKSARRALHFAKENCKTYIVTFIESFAEELGVSLDVGLRGEALGTDFEVSSETSESDTELNNETPGDDSELSQSTPPGRTTMTGPSRPPIDQYHTFELHFMCDPVTSELSNWEGLYLVRPMWEGEDAFDQWDQDETRVTEIFDP